MSMKRYKVVGGQPIEDSNGASQIPGTEFSADFEDGHEAFLIEIGAIEVVEEKTSKRKPDVPDEDE